MKFAFTLVNLLELLVNYTFLVATCRCYYDVFKSFRHIVHVTSIFVGFPSFAVALTVSTLIKFASAKLDNGSGREKCHTYAIHNTLRKSNCLSYNIKRGFRKRKN